MLVREPTITLDSLRGEGRDEGRCKMGLLLEALSPENRDVIIQALNGSELEFPAGKIVTAFRSMHTIISSDTVIKHRRGLCRCFKIEEAVNG